MTRNLSGYTRFHFLSPLLHLCSPSRTAVIADRYMRQPVLTKIIVGRPSAARLLSRQQHCSNIRNHCDNRAEQLQSEAQGTKSRLECMVISHDITSRSHQGQKKQPLKLTNSLTIVSNPICPIRLRCLSGIVKIRLSEFWLSSTVFELRALCRDVSCFFFCLYGL